MRITFLGALLCVPLLAACGSAADAPDPKVATLQSAPPIAAAPSAAGPGDAGQERPVMRLDDGREEWDQYVAVYDKCLRGEGVTITKGEKPAVPDTPEAKAAVKKCEHLYPESWEDVERRTNPKFVDLLRETAACLKRKGHDVKVGGDPIAIMYGDNTSANEAYDDEKACERDVFADSLKKYDKTG